MTQYQSPEVQLDADLLKRRAFWRLDTAKAKLKNVKHLYPLPQEVSQVPELPAQPEVMTEATQTQAPATKEVMSLMEMDDAVVLAHQAVAEAVASASTDYPEEIK